MMSREERALLLAAVALGLGRGPMSTILSPDDAAFLASLIGGTDWPTIVSGLMPLVRKVAGDA
jgi:hypothetical protein